MNLQEILAKKLQKPKEEIIEIREINKEEADKALLVFFILYTKFYSRDKRIGFGLDFISLFNFLTEGYVFKEEDYFSLPFGETIQNSFMFDLIYKVPPNVIHSLYKKFLIDSNRDFL